MASRLILCLLVCGYCAIVSGSNKHGFAVVPTSSFFASEAACLAAASPGSGSSAKRKPNEFHGNCTGISQESVQFHRNFTGNRKISSIQRGLIFSAVASDPNRVSVPLTHRHSPCTPSGASGQPSLAERLRRDRARARYIMSRVSSGRAITRLSNGGGASVPTHADAAVGSVDYVVTVGLGTPAVKKVLIMDINSALSWVQCAPCNVTSSCSPQKNPVFDPSKSSTYAPILCDTDACRGLVVDFDDNGCTNGTGPSLCRCWIEYSNADGLYITDTLTLNPGVSVNFSFGCGLAHQGTFDKFDGLLGLGGAPASLVSQKAGLYGGAFSYCLPPRNRTAGFLTLGAPRNNTAGFVFVPLYHNTTYCYAVTLAGISVAGKPLPIPPAVFSGGMVLDSIMEITVLPSTAYTALRRAFRSAMSMYPLLPPNKDYVYDLDTCYNFTGFSNVTVPTVSLSFSGGATIDIDPSGVLLEGCLAFAHGVSDGGNGLIGTVNQRTLEVLYDSSKWHVGFRSGAC
ncbi:hypothetical protein ACP4OV_001368 [Aristida adscensionis]